MANTGINCAKQLVLLSSYLCIMSRVNWGTTTTVCVCAACCKWSVLRYWALFPFYLSRIKFSWNALLLSSREWTTLPRLLPQLLTIWKRLINRFEHNMRQFFSLQKVLISLYCVCGIIYYSCGACKYLYFQSFELEVCISCRSLMPK